MSNLSSSRVGGTVQTSAKESPLQKTCSPAQTSLDFLYSETKSVEDVNDVFLPSEFVISKPNQVIPPNSEQPKARLDKKEVSESSVTQVMAFDLDDESTSLIQPAPARLRIKQEESVSVQSQGN